jgi:hypothetical protein
MAVSEVHQLHGVNIHPDSFGGSPAVLLGGIQSQSINTGTTVIREVSAGGIYPEVAHITARSPGASFVTTHVKDALDTLGIRGLCIESASNAGFQMYARKHVCSGPDSGSTHRRYTFRKGLLVPRTLSVSHQGNAALSIDMIGITDGTNDTLVIADAVAAPAIPHDTDRYTMNKLTIGGVAFNGKKTMSVDFGVQTFVEGSDSDLELSFAGVQSVQPTVAITGVEIVDWYTSLTGGAPTHANSALYLSKRGVANGVAEHIKITFAGLSYVTTVFDANGTAPATTAIVIETTYDGSLAPLVLDTASTIV